MAILAEDLRGFPDFRESKCLICGEEAEVFLGRRRRLSIPVWAVRYGG